MVTLTLPKSVSLNHFTKPKSSESPEMSPGGETIWDEKARLTVVKVVSRCVRGGESPPLVFAEASQHFPVPDASSQAVMSTGSYPAGGMQTAAEKQNLYKFQIKLLNEVLKLRFFNARYMRYSGGEKPSSDLMS